MACVPPNLPYFGSTWLCNINTKQSKQDKQSQQKPHHTSPQVFWFINRRAQEKSPSEVSVTDVNKNRHYRKPVFETTLICTYLGYFISSVLALNSLWFIKYINSYIQWGENQKKKHFNDIHVRGAIPWNAQLIACP